MTQCAEYCVKEIQYETVKNILCIYMGIGDFTVTGAFNGLNFVIYGGAIRDTIAGRPPINDVDIFVPDRDTADRMKQHLKFYGYQKNAWKTRPEDKQEQYKPLYNLFRLEELQSQSGKIIQIIYPKPDLINRMGFDNVYEQSFDGERTLKVNVVCVDLILRKFVANVDLSCCAVGLMGYWHASPLDYRLKLFEGVPGVEDA